MLQPTFMYDKDTIVRLQNNNATTPAILIIFSKYITISLYIST